MSQENGVKDKEEIIMEKEEPKEKVQVPKKDTSNDWGIDFDTPVEEVKVKEPVKEEKKDETFDDDLLNMEF